MVRGLLVAMLLLVMAPARATVADSIAPPDGAITLRRFDPERIAGYREEHVYERELVHTPSPWERFREWLSDWLGDLFEDAFGNEVGRFIGDNIFYVLAAIALVVAIIVLARGRLYGVFHGRPRSLGEVHPVTEDIRGMDFGALIADAERQGDLRRAIRLHYLWVLRRLVDQGVLHWSPEHTDRDYMGQIADPGLRSRFARVVLVFQWVWWGHAEVDAAQYDALRAPFVRFEHAPAA